MVLKSEGKFFKSLKSLVLVVRTYKNIRVFLTLELKFLDIGRGVGGCLSVESYISMLGGNLLLTYADKRDGGGGQKSENLADIIPPNSEYKPPRI